MITRRGLLGILSGVFAGSFLVNRTAASAPVVSSVFEDGTKAIYLGDGRYHLATPNGNQSWYRWNRLHREDGPALIHPCGEKHWFFDGKRHRIGGPATEWADGSKFWFKDGEYHRVGGPAIEYSNGQKVWHLNGTRVFGNPMDQV